MAAFLVFIHGSELWGTTWELWESHGNMMRTIEKKHKILTPQKEKN